MKIKNMVWDKKIGKFGMYGIFGLVFIVLVILLIRVFVIYPIYLTEDAMEPALHKGDHLFIKKVFNDLKNNEIIAYYYYPLSYDGGREVNIFRIIGIPHDIVQIKDGIIFVNDIAYGKWNLEIKDYYITRLQLSEGEYLVLPDNRLKAFGDLKSNIINRADILGKVMTIGINWNINERR